MRFAVALPACIIAVLLSTCAWAWSAHERATYTAFATMPEVADALPVKAEPIEDFLRDQEQAIETLLAAQEEWARAKIANFPQRPAALAFKADPARDDAQRRKAFLEALRVAANIKLALYVQPDATTKADSSRAMRYAQVGTLREPAFSFYRFNRLDPGDMVAPLSVLATASDEPDLGTDINCWEDSPSDWGKRYGFGKLPFGNPALDFSTQAPFHMGFFHQSAILYRAAPFVARTYPLLRIHQFVGLADLAFRTGHSYWGWRFAGNAMHYVQDLTQPYHASLFPGVSTARMMWVNTLAILGWPRMKNEMIVLVSNRHLAFERYQAQLLYRATTDAAPTPLVTGLQARARDSAYPAWSDDYVRDVLTKESFDSGEKLDAALLAVMPAKYVSDPSFDFGAQGGGVDLIAELAQRPAEQRARLDALVVDLLGHYSSHSRNLVRGLMKDQGSAAR